MTRLPFMLEDLAHVLAENRLTDAMERYELIVNQSVDHPGPDETQAKYVSRIYRRRSA